jgi:hypothetical protein
MATGRRSAAALQVGCHFSRRDIVPPSASGAKQACAARVNRSRDLGKMIPQPAIAHRIVRILKRLFRLDQTRAFRAHVNVPFF